MRGIHEEHCFATSLGDVLILKLLRVRETVALVELPSRFDRHLECQSGNYQRARRVGDIDYSAKSTGQRSRGKAKVFEEEYEIGHTSKPKNNHATKHDSNRGDHCSLISISYAQASPPLHLFRRRRRDDPHTSPGNVTESAMKAVETPSMHEKHSEWDHCARISLIRHNKE